MTAASFVGFTGFTLVMPFLPLYIGELGVADVGEVAMWTGLCLGITPAITALLSPLWGRVADRFGRKLLVERSLLSFVVIMAATAYAVRPWHVLALRAVQGVFAGYGQMEAGMPAFASEVAEVSTRVIGFAFAVNTAVIVGLQFFVLKKSNLRSVGL